MAEDDLASQSAAGEEKAPLTFRAVRERDGFYRMAIYRNGRLLVEQQLRFAPRHADRIYIMSKGRVVHHCTPPELADDAAIRSRYLGV